MAIEFVVEDGSRVDSSNSYVTIAYFKQYWENRGVDYSALADATIQPLLIQATQDIDNLNWSGIAYTETQSLNWPRVYMVNSKCKAINTDEIPSELKDAVCETAKIIYSYGSDIYNNPAGGNVRQKSIGPVSTSFFTPVTKRDYLKKVYQLLSPYLSRSQAVRV